MNKQLIYALERATKEKSQDAANQAMQIISGKKAQIDIVDLQMSPETLTSISNLAIAYLKKANTSIMKQDGWISLVGGDGIARGIVSLESNPAILNYTQVVMLIAAAIMKGE